MTCRKITASVSRREIQGVLRPPPKLSGSVERGGPIVDGIYSGGVRQTRQFQAVLEELRMQHNPQHWASWALDGSLEEDRGQFPLGMDGGWEWVDVGARKAVKFDGSNSAGLMYGTDEDFQWAHEERVFTIVAWLLTSAESAAYTTILGTSSPNNAAAGFDARHSGDGRINVIMPYSGGRQSFTPNIVFPVTTPRFLVWTGTGTGGIYRSGPNALLGTGSYGQLAIAGDPILGHSYNPLTIGWRSNATIWNAFATNHILTDAEIYRLYVAGLNDIQTF